MMTRQRFFLLVLSCLVMVFAAHTSVYADGMYFPEKAFKQMPSIPTQRALLVYRDNTETLIIESSLDAEGQSFGWIIPLPAEPTKLEKASPGMFQVLNYTTQPDITHDLYGPFLLAIFLSVYFLLIALVIMVVKRGWLIRVLVYSATTIFLIISVLTPALGGARGFEGPERVAVKQVAQVGNYDVSVLKAENGDALNCWLDAHGFQMLPAAGKLIVEDYIKKGWCFVTAQLRREGAGLCTPHPLAMTFPLGKPPFYPMRLTALSGNNVALELYVLAKCQARHEKLTLDYCNKFLGPLRSDAFGEHKPKEPKEWVWFESENRKQKLGHPSLIPLLWNEAVLTKLSAEFLPSDMDQDIWLYDGPHGFIGGDHYLPHFYSRQGARQTAVIIALLASSLCLLVITIIMRTYLWPNGGFFKWFLRVFLPTVIIGSVLMGLIYILLPKILVTTMPGKKFRIASYSLRSYVEKMEELRSSKIDATMSIETIRQIVKDIIVEEHEKENAYDGSMYVNSYTGQPLQERDAPGDYVIFQDPRGIIFRTFDMRGFPYDVNLTAPPEKDKP